MTFRVFTRRWWKDDPKGGKHLVPNHSARKYTLAFVNSEEEARRICKQYNDTHDPGKYSVKAEYIRV